MNRPFGVGMELGEIIKASRGHTGKTVAPTKLLRSTI